MKFKKIFALFLAMSLSFSVCNVFADETSSKLAIEEIDSENVITIEKKFISENFENIDTVPQYIVIHETGNSKAGANSDAHYEYWNSHPEAKASAHFVVDDNKALNLVDIYKKAWHVGDNEGYSDITNSNSIGIEICVNEDGDWEKAKNNTELLVAWLMKETGLGFDSIVTHNMASGKFCPATMLAFPEQYDDFLSNILKYSEMEISPINETETTITYHFTKSDEYISNLIIPFRTILFAREPFLTERLFVGMASPIGFSPIFSARIVNEVNTLAYKSFY